MKFRFSLFGCFFGLWPLARQLHAVVQRQDDGAADVVSKRTFPGQVPSDPDDGATGGFEDGVFWAKGELSYRSCLKDKLQIQNANQPGKHYHSCTVQLYPTSRPPMLSMWGAPIRNLKQQFENHVEAINF